MYLITLIGLIFCELTGNYTGQKADFDRKYTVDLISLSLCYLQMSDVIKVSNF